MKDYRVVYRYAIPDRTDPEEMGEWLLSTFEDGWPDSGPVSAVRATDTGLLCEITCSFEADDLFAAITGLVDLTPKDEPLPLAVEISPA